MSTDSAATAPFPGLPVGADLHGNTLTIYWPQDPATGQYPTEEIVSTDPWTRTEVVEALAGYGLTLDRCATTHGWDAFVTALAGAIAVTERAAAATARVSHAVAVVLTHRTARGHA